MFKVLLRVLFGAAVGAATIYITVRADRLAGDEQSPPEVYAAAIVLGCASLASMVGPVLQRVRSDRSEKRTRNIEARLRSLWFAMREIGEIDDLMYVGIQVWVIPKWHWTIAPYWITSRVVPDGLRKRLPTPAMNSVGEFRPRDETTSSNIYWRRGRGVIGKCWQYREVIRWNNRKDWKPGMSEADWLALTPEERLGLKKYEDYRRLSDNYGQVLAVPIDRQVKNVGHTFVVGCIVVDTPPRWGRRVNIHSKKVESIVRTAALDLRGLVT